MDTRFVTGAEWLLALRERQNKPLLATRIPELDQLHDGGLRRGTLVGVAGQRSSGRTAIALAVLAAATEAGETAAWVDPDNQFDPESAQASGISLSRLLWTHPPNLSLSFLCAEMVLAAGFGLVVLDLGLRRLSRTSCSDGVWLRLAQAAVEQKAILLVLTLEPLPTMAVDVLVRTEGARPTWLGERRSRLLSGLSVYVTVRKRKREYSERSGMLTFWSRESQGK
jgi:hypothetical protein